MTPLWLVVDRDEDQYTVRLDRLPDVCVSSSTLEQAVVDLSKALGRLTGRCLSSEPTAYTPTNEVFPSLECGYFDGSPILDGPDWVHLGTRLWLRLRDDSMFAWLNGAPCES